MKNTTSDFGKEIWMLSDGAVRKAVPTTIIRAMSRELENIIEQAVSMGENEHVLTEKILAMPGSFAEDQQGSDGRIRKKHPSGQIYK